MPNRPLWSLAPFDLTKKKKKTFFVQDAIEDSTESHGRYTIRYLIVQEEFIFDSSFTGSQEVEEEEAKHPNDEEEVEGIDLHQQRYPWERSDMDYLYDEVIISLDGLRSIFESRRLEITKLAMCQDIKSISVDGKWGCYVGCLVYWAWLYKAQAGNICVAAFDSTCSGICRSADPIVEFIHGSQEVKEEEAKHPNDEEEVEGIDLHQQRYPWEGNDMDYLYDEVSILLDGLRSIFESRRLNKYFCHAIGQFYAISRKLISYLSHNQQVGMLRWVLGLLGMAIQRNICVAAFDSTCSGICRSADPIVEVNMQYVDLEIIIWKLHFEAFPQHINRP
ncbi:hypothetical protein F2Q69_00004012 [Brassica cretica]|uniref:Uncharacterized protein n=1 Tax=Brassica cretica TaxID=69181 RepID=A0A8S9PCD6_BRACR|nr:hypothetical protein F2Q69_00004012 [Brassica cretica]